MPQILCLFGVQWVMPQRVVDLLASWKGRYARHRNGDVWSVIPLCIMWIIWKEWNNQTFEGLERPSVELNLIFLCTLYEWMAALSDHSFSNFLDFLDCCNQYNRCHKDSQLYYQRNYLSLSLLWYTHHVPRGAFN